MINLEKFSEMKAKVCSQTSCAHGKVRGWLICVGCVGRSGLEWVAWVGVGWSGLCGWSESEMVIALHRVWLKYKTSFPCIINIFHNKAASCILSQLLNFCSPCVLALLRLWMNHPRGKKISVFTGHL